MKQKELQPWTAKINSKQAEIDVASSERDALVKKAQAVKEAGVEAQETLNQLQGDQQVKVGLVLHLRRDHYFFLTMLHRIGQTSRTTKVGQVQLAKGDPNCREESSGKLDT